MIDKEDGLLREQEAEVIICSSNTDNNSPPDPENKAEDDDGPPLVEWFAEVFSGGDRGYGTYNRRSKPSQGKVEVDARTVRGAPTLDLYAKHLAGMATLGIVPIRSDNTVLFAAIDIDQYDLEFVDLLKRIERERLPLVLCRSKSGGAHLYAFFAEPVPASDAQSALKVFATALGFQPGPGVEIFPKQKTLGPDDIGNWINMPYFGGDATDCYAVKATGMPMTLYEFLELTKRSKMSPADLAGHVARLKPTVDAESSYVDAEGQPTVHAATQADASARLVYWARAVEHAGDRDANNSLSRAAFDLGRYVRDAGLSTEDAESRILAAWRTRKPGDDGDQEFNEVWHRQLRNGQAIGWPAQMWNGKGLPYFEHVRIERDGDDTVWEFQVEGKHIRVPAQDVLDQRKFNKHAVTQIDKGFLLSKTQNSWIAHINRAGEMAEHVSPPRGTSASEVFFEFLDEFLTNRRAGLDAACLHLGQPWHDEKAGRYRFRLKDLKAYLGSAGYPNESAKKIADRIRDLGGDQADVNARGKTLYAWWVPDKLFVSQPKASLPPLDDNPLA